MFSGDRGQPGRCATCVEPSGELKLKAHRCMSSIFWRSHSPRDILVTYVPCEYQHADILTKALLVYDAFVVHRFFLMDFERLSWENYFWR